MNYFKTFGLMAVLTFLFLFIGGAIGGQSGMIMALVFAGGANFISYFWSDKLVLRAYRAQELPADHRVPRIVTRLAQKAGLPIPKVYVIDQEQPNAFATGRNPKHAAIAVTRGLADNMNDSEISGVLGHELGHIANRDILIGTIASTLAGAISYLGYASRFGMGRRSSNQGGNILRSVNNTLPDGGFELRLVVRHIDKEKQALLEKAFNESGIELCSLELV